MEAGEECLGLRTISGCQDGKQIGSDAHTREEGMGGNLPLKRGAPPKGGGSYHYYCKLG